ncbi:hypothetical protein BJV74DRAFT_799746 [Russula compacta]|nr:hypothetical protein BJV74DRAFT_799746 [Russula compacta]
MRSTSMHMNQTTPTLVDLLEDGEKGTKDAPPTLLVPLHSIGAAWGSYHQSLSSPHSEPMPMLRWATIMHPTLVYAAQLALHASRVKRTVLLQGMYFCLGRPDIHATLQNMSSDASTIRMVAAPRGVAKNGVSGETDCLKPGRCVFSETSPNSFGTGFALRHAEWYRPWRVRICYIHG